MQQLPADHKELIRHITEVLSRHSRRESIFPPDISAPPAASAVLFLLGRCRPKGDKNTSRPCLVFNKRSAHVRQAGDLCFPGGRMMPRIDFYFSRFLSLPFSPLIRWPDWGLWRKQRPQQARRLSLLLAAGLRESLEEMRLNPLGVHFLGPMPSQRLRMFPREIYPMAVWINRQQRFFPNWEVEKIIAVPIRSFLDPAHYARCRISFGPGRERPAASSEEIFPCFCLPDASEPEILWGATYRMVIRFLELVFDFRPPPVDALPLVSKRLGEGYINTK